MKPHQSMLSRTWNSLLFVGLLMTMCAAPVIAEEEEGPDLNEHWDALQEAENARDEAWQAFEEATTDLARAAQFLFCKN